MTVKEQPIRERPHSQDQEVQPTPEAPEVPLQSESGPLDEHLQQEEEGEDLVGSVEDHLKVEALKHLEQEQEDRSGVPVCLRVLQKHI